MKKDLKYSQALGDLEEIVESLQEENVDVDELALKVKRATELIKICRKKIQKTELEIKNILKKFEEEEKNESKEA